MSGRKKGARLGFERDRKKDRDGRKRARQVW